MGFLDWLRGLFHRESKLSEKQLAQRKYASQMRVVRERAGDSAGGKGPIADREAASKLRRKFGLKRG